MEVTNQTITIKLTEEEAKNLQRVLGKLGSYSVNTLTGSLFPWDTTDQLYRTILQQTGISSDTK